MAFRQTHTLQPLHREEATLKEIQVNDLVLLPKALELLYLVAPEGHPVP